MHFLPQEIIKRKRDGKSLSSREIDFFIQGIAKNSISEGQIAAFAMAVFFQGMNATERYDFTQSMVHSGDVLDWSDMHLSGPVLDKHSTGGVGDKVSLMLAPIIAACGGFVPMISGRGLGHTGGTLDKFDAIKGYNSSPSIEKFRQTVKQVGCAIIGQTQNLAPADKRFYATRDITATVDCIPLIVASILSKKLAEGLDGLVMDVKTGNGAFMQKQQDAKNLAQAIVETASVKTTAIITDMSQVIGTTVGNSLEMHEAIAYLTGKNPDPLLHELVQTLAAQMLLQGKLVSSLATGKKKVNEVLASGQAAQKFAQMVAALGGPFDLLEKPNKYLAKAPIMQAVFAKKTGYVTAMNSLEIGLALLEMGGGRRHASDTIDYAVGFSKFCHIGDKIEKDTPLAFVHAQNENQALEMAEKVTNAIEIKAHLATKPCLIQAII